MMIDLEECFERNNDEFLEFHRVVNPKHPRPDICAFLMLHELTDGDGNVNNASDMVSSAEHDEIYLSAAPDLVAEKATEEDIVTLIRCGVRYTEDRFCMFV